MNTTKQLERIYSILRALQDWGEPILKTELVILVEEQNYAHLIGLLDGLCFGGYIRYEMSEMDARLCWVSLSDNGKNYLRLIDEIPF